jgi:hypothetical protein
MPPTLAREYTYDANWKSCREICPTVRLPLGLAFSIMLLLGARAGGTA